MQCNKEFLLGEQVPFPECHASTVLRLADGDLLAAWFGGSKEGCDDVQIWLSRRRDGVWTVPNPVTKEPEIPHWNPVLFQTDTNTVSLYYKVGKEIPFWQTMVMESGDGGLTWSEPRELVPGDEGGRGPVKNKPIRCSDGKILAPASIEQGPWRCFMDVSPDGHYWEKKSVPVRSENVNMIQPSLWESPEGNIHALMRTNVGFIYRTDSEDFGETWCPAYPIDMPNNNSGLDCVLMENGILALVCNPVEKNWGPRSPLTLFLSEDNGATFRKLLDLESESGEYSYPAVIADGNVLIITYTWNRKDICCWEIQL